MNSLRASLLVAGLLALGGCKKDETTAPAADGKKPLLTLSGAGKGGAVAPAGADANLHGTVVERLDAPPSYTYLKIKSATGEVWAAVPTSTVAVGTEVTVMNPMPMQNFESKTLNRTFDVVMFASSAEVGNVQAPAGGAPAGAAMAPMGDKAGSPIPPAVVAADLSNIKVAKAAGADGRTVAEVWGQKDALKDKTISVRAKVVKMTGGVLGKNWLHLRDGSGADGTKDNDLVVTTTENAAVNDEVTVTGVVHTDKDLGSGYQYPVIIEDAKITK